MTLGVVCAEAKRHPGPGSLVSYRIEGRPWGERSFCCTDPDGHPLCFVDDTTLFLGRGADWA